MKVVLCEKPSQAQQIAQGLSKLVVHAPVKKERNCLKVGDYCLFWAQGHLLEIDTRKTKKVAGSFPYFPRYFCFTPSSRRAHELLSTMKPIMQKADEIIVATDFGREGELIARLILDWIKANPRARYYRLWTSASLSPQVVARAFREVRPLSDFDLLHEEARARQASDWIVGINLSLQLMKLTGDGESWSVGRVQTPTLAIVVNRELQIRGFRPEPYALVFAHVEAHGTVLKAKLIKSSEEADENEEGSEETPSFFESPSQKEKARWGFSPEEAEALVRLLRRECRTLRVASFQERRQVVAPPLLHTLTTLQTKVTRRGFSAGEIAQAAQSLYEKGLISYPRTESQYLATVNIRDVQKLLRMFGREDLLRRCNEKNRIFNDRKVTDHHGLIPQGVLREALSGAEQAVYDEVKATFLAQFEEEAVNANVRLVLEAETSQGKKAFFWRETVVVKPGWRKLFGVQGTGELSLSRPLKKGDVLPARDFSFTRKETRPPERLTEGSLLNIMKNAHLLIPPEQKRLRELMRKKENPGLGTAATRTGIIQTLYRRGYMEKKGRSLVPTEKGLQLIKRLYGRSRIVDPILTAEFEERLALIGKGRYTRERFLREIEDLVLKEIQVFDDLKLKELGGKKMECPLCGETLRFERVVVECPSCGRLSFRKFCGKELSNETLSALLSGKEVPVKGLKSKAGKSFDAVLVWNRDEKRIVVKGFIDRKPASKAKGSGRKGSCRKSYKEG